MAVGRWAGITWLVVGGALLFDGVHCAYAKPPEPAVTIARVQQMIEQAKRKSTYFARKGRLLPDDWGRATPDWRLSSSRRDSSHSPIVRQLVADAICRQHAASIKQTYKLDRYRLNRVFGQHEVLIANEIARRGGLKVSFRAPLAIAQDQSLKDINRTRQIKRTLSEHGPAVALTRVVSFDRLCREAVTQ